jgi:hypothetical protein
MFQRFNDDWIIDNLIHNRLNFGWTNTSNTVHFALELRNRFIAGESVKIRPAYAGMINSDDGFIQLSSNLATGSSYILNSRIDRLFADYTLSKLQVRIGRQRINWGQNYAWNPNDIFNAYSFFDFDYPEKPGSDAIRVQYYTGTTSGFEAALKSDRFHRTTLAVLYRFNRWNYDFQFLSGILNSEDYVVGAGWSGSIGGAAFTGELSYFRPKHHFKDTSGILTASVGGLYTFQNSFTLQCEFLYNQQKNNSVASFADLYSMTLSPKMLSLTTLSVMLMGSYPITPLCNVSLAAIYFPGIDGIFLGPTLTYSLTNNLDFSLITQSFTGKPVNNQPQSFHFGYLRLKMNF